MELREEIFKIFAEVFEVEIETVSDLTYQSVETWDSIGHMMMISAIEEKFEISIEMDDVIVISNVEECLNIVSKYTK